MGEDSGGDSSERDGAMSISGERNEGDGIMGVRQRSERIIKET